MSNRQTIIDLIKKHTVCTVEDLADETRWPQRKVQDTLSDLKKLQIVKSEIDDVTRKAMYRLLPGAALGKKAVSVKPQPAVGQITPASTDRKPRVAGGVLASEAAAEPPAEAVAVIEPPKPDEAPAAACSDDIPAPDYDPREVSFNHREREQALLEQRAELDAKLGFAQKEIASLRDRLLVKEEEVQALLDDVRRQVQRAVAAEQNRDDLKARLLEAEVKVTELEIALKSADDDADAKGIETFTLRQRIAQLESNAELPLSSNPLRYLVTDRYMMADSEAEAAGMALAIAADGDVDAPVMVAALHSARELRINWRDA